MLPGPCSLLRESQPLFAKNSTPMIKEQGKSRRVWGYYLIMWPGLLRLAPAGSGSRYRCYCWNGFLCYPWSFPPSPGPLAQAGSWHSQEQSHLSLVQAAALLLHEKPRLFSSHRPPLGHADTVTLGMSWQSAYFSVIQSRLTEHTMKHYFSCKIFASIILQIPNFIHFLRNQDRHDIVCYYQ